MMRDPITDASQDPSCLLCLTPDRGGSWWSRLRPPTPRVFSTSAYWPGFVSAFNSNGIKNYHFSIKFSLSEMPSRDRVLFGNQMALGEGRFMLVLSSKGKIQVQDESSWSGMVEHPISGTGKHTVMIKIAESSGRIMIDGVEYAVSVSRTAPILTIAFSNFPGTISSILLESDSGTLWQAAYSDLYDTSNPWPSPVPENFAENAKAFYDCQAVVQEALDPTHDYSFLIEANRVSERTENLLFYAGTDKSPFGVYYHADHTIKFSTNLLRNEGDPSGTYANLNFYTGTDWLLGRHAFEARIEGNAITTYVDGVQYATSNKFARTGTVAVGLPNCNSGYVYRIQITDLTDNQVVWSYPSEAERVRLITKTNVRTDRGAFEAADETQPARVDTALDLRGKVSSYTVVVDFEAIAPDGTQSKMELAGQGASVTNYPSICALAQSGATGNIQLSQEINGIRKIVYKAPDNQLGRHVAVGVVDVGNSSTRLAVYYDGDLLAEDTINGLPTGTCDPRAVNWAIFDNRNGFNNMRYGKIYSALLFDRALSAAEIAALTPKKQPLSWAGIRDVVRRGRAQRYFAVGDVLTVATPRWTIEYEVTGFDQVEPADAALTHSMTLLPVRLVTDLQFDAPEPGNPDANRAQYGCNRWDWSAIRQWMNSAAAPGEWWTVQHEYDAAPDYAATLAGFMADLPADFLSAVAPARLVTALPNADGGGSVETVDRFWLPSRTEIFGYVNNGVAEGVQMTKYIDATDADRLKYNSAGTASGWELRSPNSANSYNISNVSANGTWQGLTWSSVWSGGIVPACIIA